MNSKQRSSREKALVWLNGSFYVLMVTMVVVYLLTKESHSLAFLYVAIPAVIVRIAYYLVKHFNR